MTRQARGVSDIESVKQSLMATIRSRQWAGYSTLPKPSVKSLLDPKDSSHELRRLYVIDGEVLWDSSAVPVPGEEEKFVLCIHVSTAYPADDEFHLNLHLVIAKQKTLVFDNGKLVDYPNSYNSAVEYPKDVYVAIGLTLHLCKALPGRELGPDQMHSLEIDDLSVSKMIENRKVMSTMMTHLFNVCYDCLGPMKVSAFAAHVATTLLVYTDKVNRDASKVYFGVMPDPNPGGADAFNVGIQYCDNILDALVEFRSGKVKQHIAACLGPMLFSPPAKLLPGISAPPCSSTVAGVPPRVYPDIGYSEESINAALRVIFRGPPLQDEAKVDDDDPAMDHYLTEMFKR